MKVCNFGRKSWKKGEKEIAESDGAVTNDPSGQFYWSKWQKHWTPLLRAWVRTTASIFLPKIEVQNTKLEKSTRR